MARRPALPAEAEDTTAAHVHVKRPDGLECTLDGDAGFVSRTLERLLVGLGVLPPPTPPS